VFVHHVEMHEFWLWCDFKSLKKIVKKSLKIIVKKIIEDLCKRLIKKMKVCMFEKLFKRVCEKPLK
jgi:hypothetical protein